MFNYRKLFIQIPLLLGWLLLLTACTSTYQAPEGNPNVANLTYSNSDSVYIKSNPVDCSGNQELPTKSASFLTMFSGGVDPYATTKIVAGSLVTLGFSGENLAMPALSTDNQISSKVLSLLTRGKHDSSVSESQFKQAAEANCDFMVSFIPERDANYRYIFTAKNVGHDLGGATFRCSLQIQSYKADKWTAVPVIQRTANLGQFHLTEQSVPSNCSTAGLLAQLQSGNISDIPKVTTVSKEFTIQSDTATGGMITGS